MRTAKKTTKKKLPRNMTYEEVMGVIRQEHDVFMAFQWFGESMRSAPLYDQLVWLMQHKYTLLPLTIGRKFSLEQGYRACHFLSVEKESLPEIEVTLLPEKKKKKAKKV